MATKFELLGLILVRLAIVLLLLVSWRTEKAMPSEKFLNAHATEIYPAH
jgi:hypothetical protein